MKRWPVWLGAILMIIAAAPGFAAPSDGVYGGTVVC